VSALTPLPIAPPPGVVLTESGRASEGRWIASNNVRFVKGRPQKLGGNVRSVVTPTSGTPRTSHAWRDNVQNNYLAAGTYRKLYAYDSSWIQNDITPYRALGSLGANPLSVVSGSPVVTVNHTLHGLNVGDFIYLFNATAIGGITPSMPGGTVVNTVIDANHYTYVFTSNATSTVTGGGGSAPIQFFYEIPVGVEIGVYGLGWGVGGWGLGTWGTARTASTIFIEPRIWSLDHFGKLLIASYNGGSIYQFDPTAAQPWGRATLISADAGLPINCRFALVTPERFIFALLDNMQIAWCTQGDITVWTPATANTANIRTLTEGTKLVAGRVLSDFVTLVWTDAALYRFQYTGSTFVYNSSMISKDCGLIAPGAAVTAGGVAYWMGQDTFWMYNGSVQPIPNVEDIRKYVFDNLKTDYGYQCSAVFSPQHNEVWFFYTVIGQTNPTLGVVYSIENQCWAPLNFGRTSGTHFTQGDTRPYMGGTDGFIYQHENGLDDNGAILPWSITLAPYALNEGGSHFDVQYVVADFLGQIGNISLTLNTFDRLNDSAQEDSETEIVTPLDSGTIDMRVSGRYIGMVASCASLGSYFRWGKPVAWIQDSGNRS
jgi:hypothetical protein